jgi:Ca-activated chloride channel family protein
MNELRIADCGLRIAAVLVATALATPVHAAERSPRELVVDANKLISAGEFQKALDAYKSAEVMLPDAPELAYDQGVAYYRLKDYAKAREQFSKALTTRDLTLEARAKYNLGNCAYAESLQKLSDLQAAIDGLRQAISHYRDALEINPNDNDARANIEMAQLLIKDLLDKQKQQQEQQKQNPDQKQDQQKQDQQQQDQQQQNQQQQNPESQPSSQPSESQEQKQDQKQDQQRQQQQQQQEQKAADDQQKQDQREAQKPQSGEKRAMTQQEAERLLQAVRDREKQHQDQQARRVRVKRVPVEKDW